MQAPLLCMHQGACGRRHPKHRQKLHGPRWGGRHRVPGALLHPFAGGQRGQHHVPGTSGHGPLVGCVDDAAALGCSRVGWCAEGARGVVYVHEGQAGGDGYGVGYVLIGV